MSYLYLLQTRESIKLNESIYKIGRTKQEGLKRFEQYPNGSELILHIKCDNCVEKEKIIKDLFKTKFKQVTEYGTEYFMGDVEQMMIHVLSIAKGYIFNTTSADNVQQTKTQFDGTQEKSKIAEILINKGIILQTTADDISHTTINQTIILPKNNSSSDNNQEILLCKETNNKNNESESKFVCEICNMSYKTQNGLYKHNKKYHPTEPPKKTYLCECCPRVFKSRQSKWFHMQKCKEINSKKISLEEKVNQLTEKVNTLEKNPQHVTNNKIIFV